MDNNQHFYANLIGIRLEEFDPNPHSSYSRPRERKDCIIRSLCKVTGKSWDEVYREYVEIGFEEETMGSSHHLTTEFLDAYGYHRKADGIDHMTIGEFMFQHKTGSYLLANRQHICAYIDGVLYDSPSNLKYANMFIASPLCTYYTTEEIPEKKISEKKCLDAIAFAEDESDGLGTKLWFYDSDTGNRREPDKEITVEEWKKLRPSQLWEYDSKNWSKEPTAICDHKRLGWEPCHRSENGYCYFRAGSCSSQMKLDGSGEMNDEMKNAIIQGIAEATGGSESTIKKEVEEAWSH